MAEKILNTRILMKVDTLENWSKSTLKLKKGELAFATVAASAGTGLDEPVVMMKVGSAEEKTFAELPWSFHAKASDVLAACKTEAGLQNFIKAVLASEGVASNSVMEALAQRVTTAEGEIDTLQSEMDAVEKKASDNASAIEAINGKFGAETVALEIDAAINALKLGETYAAKSLETTVANHVADGVAHVTADDKIKWNNALQASDVVTGSANGTISIKGSDVAVKGLGSAAYTEASAYDASGSAAAAQTAAVNAAKAYTDEREVEIKKYADQAEADALKDAKTYTDTREAAIKTAYEAYADQAETDAKAYTDSEMTRLVGDTKVATQITNAITALNLGNTYDAKGAAAQALVDAKAYADAEDAKIESRVEALEAIDHSHTFVESELNLIQSGDVAKWNAAEQNAKNYADGLNTAMDSRVDALEAKFTGDDSVADQIADAVAGEAELREQAIAGLQEQIGSASAEGKDATGLHARIEELESLVGDDKVSDAIADAVKVEADRAKGVESGLETRLKAVEDTYATDDDIAGLQTQINTIMNNPDAEGAINSINEFTQYVADHGTIAEGMRTDINKNKADIEAEVKRAGEAEAALQGAINGVAADLETLEGEVAKKALQSDLTALAGRVTTIENEHNTETTGLKARLTQAEADIDALELLVGDDTVSKQITDVTNPLAARIVELEKVDHDHANKAELDKIADGDKAKWDAKLENVTASATSGLKATKTGNNVAIEIDDSVTWIFDCGTSAV